MRFERALHVGAHLAAAALLAATAALTGGCSTKTLVRPRSTPLSRIKVTPAADTLVAGGNQLFVATAYDTGGTVVPGEAISWTSTNPGVASVAAAGLVSALAEGTSKIIASAGGKADTASLLVYGSATGWVTQTSGATANLNGVYFLADGLTGFAVGNAGTLVRTMDAGAHWSPGASGTALDLASVWFPSPLVGWSVGAAGTVLKTVNGGASWTLQTNVGVSQNLTCVRFADGAHGWITGSGGVIAATRDSGATWTRSFPTAQTLNGVAFADSSNGWAVGNGGVIVGTHDGGASWYLVQPAVTTQHLKGVGRLGGSANDTLGIAVGVQGTLARTVATPDSLVWTLSDVGASYQVNAVHIVDATTAYAVGASPAGLVLKSVDGGSTWTPQVANSTQPLSGVFFLDAQRGWAVGAAGRIVHTSHGGN